MADFNNNNNFNNGDDFNSQNNQYYYNQNQNPYNQNMNPNGGMNGNMNEFSYKPNKPKKPIGKKILTGVIAVLCVAAVATTSIAGYTLITGNKLGTDEGNSSSVSVKNTKNDSSSSVDRKNLPTLEQLAAPEDAMSIPDIVKKVSPSVVGISCIISGGVATGSGIIMSEDGYIITNAHVVSGAQSISVILPNSYSESSDSSSSSKASDNDVDSNLTYTAELVGKDSQTDIAVLKIDKKGLTAAEFGTSADVQVGELSIVIGNPLGLSLANSVTAGIISAKDRTLTVEDRTMNFIQTDSSINNGNSGGPLINAYGQVIGITSAKVSNSVGEGLGFAIPIDEALPIIQDLMKNGYVTGRPSLGISGSDITSAMSQYYGVPQGFLVASVSSGSGAAKAGIQANDIIIGINDTVVTSINELNEVKNKCKPGDTVTLTVYRNGKKSDFKVTLGEATNTESNEDDTESSQSSRNNNYDDYRQYFNDYGLGF